MKDNRFKSHKKMQEGQKRKLAEKIIKFIEGLYYPITIDTLFDVHLDNYSCFGTYSLELCDEEKDPVCKICYYLHEEGIQEVWLNREKIIREG